MYSLFLLLTLIILVKLWQFKYSFLPFLIQQNVKARWEKHVKKWNQFQMQAGDILVDNVNRLHPIPSMKWSEVDIVYVPINVQSMHQVFEVVHLTQRRIFVYDSLIDINSDNRLKGVIIPLAKVLSRILHATSYYGKSSDPKSEK